MLIKNTPEFYLGDFVLWYSGVFFLFVNFVFDPTSQNLSSWINFSILDQ